MLIVITIGIPHFFCLNPIKLLIIKVRSPRLRLPDFCFNGEIVKGFCLLFEEEHSNCAGENENSAAKTEKGSLAAGVPLNVGLAEQIDTH